jgi:XTP/dITP diphosphohydrolase
MTTLVVASRNAHKVAEIQTILGSGFTCLPLTRFPGAPRLVENGDTFSANAAMKAVQLATWLATQETTDARRAGLVLADDSGLEVDALGGAPGVISARFAADEPGGPDNATDSANNAKLLRLLADIPLDKRIARFHCVMALVEVQLPSSVLHPLLFDGVCEGRIGFVPRGLGGFGYDPLFVPDGFTQSFAELGEETKNGLSHRFKALDKLRQHLLGHRSAAR